MIRFYRSAASGLALALLCAAPLAMAQDTVATRTADGVAYVNGGFGDDEASSIRQGASNYSLRMQFARQHNGEFLSGVDLAVQDQSGKTVFTLPKAGPMTDVMLPPGNYQVRASYGGHTETQAITIGGAGRAGKDIAFRWTDAEAP